MKYSGRHKDIILYLRREFQNSLKSTFNECKTKEEIEFVSNRMREDIVNVGVYFMEEIQEMNDIKEGMIRQSVGESVEQS